MDTLFPWIMALIVVPFEVWMLYFIATHVRKRAKDSPKWLKVVISAIFIWQFAILLANCHIIYNCFDWYWRQLS